MAEPRQDSARGETGAEGEEAEEPQGWRERARHFVFDEQAEHERFGVFDPALRASYMVTSLTLAVLLAASVIEAMGGPRPASFAGALLGFGAVMVVALLAHRKIWQKPSEREILLQMAREDDEARALGKRLAKEDAEAAPRQRNIVDRRGHR